LTAEERRIAAMFAKMPGSDRFQLAADRVRSQSGLRKRFAAGIGRWSGYREEMRDVFRARGLPTELIVIPLFESCFNLDAYSKVGAAGVWQFMPSTGRLFMRVDGAIDERRDPIRSTEAAAAYLGRDYELLGSWPLAITAYNHGRGGMARATSELGTRTSEPSSSRTRETRSASRRATSTRSSLPPWTSSGEPITSGRTSLAERPHRAARSGCEAPCDSARPPARPAFRAST
jgi:membrane-bound lytic murein transglycosylase D